MTRILLTPQRLDTESSRLTQAAADINCINGEIARLVSSLDWQVRSRGNVESLIGRAASEGKALAAEGERLGQYLRTASQTFQEADANAKTRLEETTCMMPISLGRAGGVAVAGGFIAGLVTGGQKFASTGLSWIKKVIGVDSSDETQTKESKSENEIKEEKNDIVEKAAPNKGAEKTNLKIETFMKSHPNNSLYTGSEGCKGFAKQYYKNAFDIELPSTNKAKQYELYISDTSKIAQVGQVVNNSNIVNVNDVKKLFSNATSGDMVQMVGTSGLHSAIIDGIDDTGITFYDANFVTSSQPTNLIQIRHVTFEKYAEYLSCSRGGVTIYSPKGI